MSLLEFFEPTILTIKLLVRFWWLWLAPSLFVIFRGLWLVWRQQLYMSSISWVSLELKMPREIEKSPKAMEQVLAALYPLRNSPGDIVDTYQAGEVTLWWSLEIFSFGGDIHFLMRIPEKHKRIIVSNLYANYPMIEVEEVPDYLDRLPQTFEGLRKTGQDIWGGEVVLKKEDAYPIRTYLQFENLEESMAVDPIAGLMETLSRLDRHENLFFQIVIRPADDAWKKKGEMLIKQLKIEGQKTIVGPLGEFTDRPIRTPGETETLKAIEESLSKPGYETLIRYVYMTHKDRMSGEAKDFARRSIMTALNQYMSQDLNSFERNPKVTTDVKWTYYPWVFVSMRLEARKARIWSALRMRRIPEHHVGHKLLNLSPLHANVGQRTSILNTEELATLFHPPTHIVLTGPLIKRVEAKKMGPSVGLEMFEDKE